MVERDDKMDDKMLMMKAKEGLKFAYAPYSGVKVAAAILGKSEKVYVGCNVENSSYGATICAERSALVKAVSEGEREFEAIAITSNLPSIMPCGICRQSLAEFAPNIRVVYELEGGLKFVNLSELLPSAFKLNAGEDNF